MHTVLLITLAKILRRGLRVVGGHGSALPGKMIERIDHNFLAKMLASLPSGVVVVTGTNGKTTTTHMLVHILRKQGVRVLTNASGSNLTRGLISAIVEHSSWRGELPYDIAVFELDEAYAPLFAAKVHPRMLVCLNVMRDQLDRYGELDVTASLIGKAAAYSRTAIVNGNDELLMKKTSTHPDRYTFGLDDGLLEKVMSEANLYGEKGDQKSISSKTIDAKIVEIKTTDKETRYTLKISQSQSKVKLPLLGSHNALNSSAAIFTTLKIMPKLTLQDSTEALAEFVPAFGRGETVKLMDREVTVALIKNPSGFIQNLNTFVRPTIDAVMIVINDDYADGRDVSWLWDVQLDLLESFEGVIFVSGTRRYDMALRLKYQKIPYRIVEEPTPAEALAKVMTSDAWHRHLLVIPTYTGMLSTRKWIQGKLRGKHIW